MRGDLTQNSQDDQRLDRAFSVIGPNSVCRKLLQRFSSDR
jgi:hypothetical protein